jgi:hypothetical protein
MKCWQEFDQARTWIQEPGFGNESLTEFSLHAPGRWQLSQAELLGIDP